MPENKNNIFYNHAAFLNKDIQIEANNYNINGEHCEFCQNRPSCLLFKNDFKHLCFKGLKKLMDHSVPGTPDFLAVDSIVYQLKTFVNPKLKPVGLFERNDCLTDLAPNNPGLSEKARIVYAFLGKQVLDILRSRGYSI
ncbi:MAG: hypothetical protein JW974_03875 [Alphaproteobacteria bacterium]|nr:hypothetical protein [Alphaproteobacteria bacterium]MBN2675126.1 hypothetical protein [Alphaproteobacteria bacterium]